MPAESAKKMEHEHDARGADHDEKKDHGQDAVAAQQHGSHEAAAKAAEAHEADNDEKKDHGQDAAGAGGSHDAEKKSEGGHGKDHKEAHESTPQPSKLVKKGALAVVWEKTKKFFNWLKNLVS